MAVCKSILTVNVTTITTGKSNHFLIFLHTTKFHNTQGGVGGGGGGNFGVKFAFQVGANSSEES